MFFRVDSVVYFIKDRVWIWLVVSGALDLIFRGKRPAFISEGLEGKVRGGVRDARA